MRRCRPKGKGLLVPASHVEAPVRDAVGYFAAFQGRLLNQECKARGCRSVVVLFRPSRSGSQSHWTPKHSSTHRCSTCPETDTIRIAPSRRSARRPGSVPKPNSSGNGHRKPPAVCSETYCGLAPHRCKALRSLLFTTPLRPREQSDHRTSSYSTYESDCFPILSLNATPRTEHDTRTCSSSRLRDVTSKRRTIHSTPSYQSQRSYHVPPGASKKAQHYTANLSSSA